MHPSLLVRRRTGRLLAVPLVVSALAAVATSPAAAAPSPSASCAAQLNQGSTPHGAAQADPSFHGQFTSQEARTAPGAQGDGTSSAAQAHGDLLSCLPQ